MKRVKRMSQIPRIYLVEAAIKAGELIALNEEQSHYLVRVLRLSVGAKVKLLGKAGMWLAEITDDHKKHAQLRAVEQVTPFQPSPDIWLVFAPIKNDKIDALAKSAAELGVSGLWPIKTDYTQNTRINQTRLKANLVQAAEQCSRMDVPELYDYMSLVDVLANWDPERVLFHADESGAGVPIHTLMQGLKKPAKAAILIGPEGGFSGKERELIAAQPFAKGCTLGPRILRAETAALVGLAHLQAWLGDGEGRPYFMTTES